MVIFTCNWLKISKDGNSILMQTKIQKNMNFPWMTESVQVLDNNGHPDSENY
jgi:hypothetical protein